ncbi:hypothetical protein AA309_05485 [Microvirga vignae]|uniref:Uncharacterized protein n=1 Tax=Microvirga vignae TaxID=1225564 RepID=A0A0H1RFV8_9HYPH|nr:hypothetical protein [Microvirga vignae]KLK93934.1 hypothetical protein AA309_05485 [Microvirga vignae]
MGKFDNDRHQKELAIRYCLAKGTLPFLEVVVSSVSDISESVEVLTDIDVLGVEYQNDGQLFRTIFDCKTRKESAVNRALWARGLMAYTGCDYCISILRSAAVTNHRLSALAINVDLHEEKSFIALGESFDIEFNKDNHYQSSIDRWNKSFEAYAKYRWSEVLFGQVRSVVPLTDKPWNVFRRLIAELKEVRGYIDPNKPDHLCMFYDLLGSAFVLWATMARDLRRVYLPTMVRNEFETLFRHYIWGGQEAYELRRQMSELMPRDEKAKVPFELANWAKLVDFAGLVIAAPQSVFQCAHVCRELSIRSASGPVAQLDARIGETVRRNARTVQYIMALSSYFVGAANLPRDLAKAVEAELGSMYLAAAPST